VISTRRSIRPGAAGATRQDVAGTLREALRVFQGAQLGGGVDQHVRVAADTDAAGRREPLLRRENAVTEIRLGHRAKAYYGGARGEAGELAVGGVGRVHQAPARIRGLMLEQPLDRAAPAPGEALLDLAGLLGDVQVNDAAARELHDGGELRRRHRAQAVRRDADLRPGQAAHRHAALLEDAGEALGVADEAQLAGGGCRAAEAAVRVEHRQQRKSDAAVGGGRGDAPGELAAGGERGAAAIVVQVVELADVGEAALEHLRVAQRGQRLEFIGTDALDETVHELAPAPEAVGAGAAPLGEAGEAALEGVTVNVGQPRQSDRVALIARLRGNLARDAGDRGAAVLDAHVPRPARGQQRRLKPQARHGLHY